MKSYVKTVVTKQVKVVTVITKRISGYVNKVSVAAPKLKAKILLKIRVLKVKQRKARSALRVMRRIANKKIARVKTIRLSLKRTSIIAQNAAKKVIRKSKKIVKQLIAKKKKLRVRVNKIVIRVGKKLRTIKRKITKKVIKKIPKGLIAKLKLRIKNAKKSFKRVVKRIRAARKS